MLQLISPLYRLQEALHHTSKRAALAPAETKLEKALGKAFRAQGKSFVGGLVQLASQFPTDQEERGFTITPGGVLRPALRSLCEGLAVDDTDSYFDQADDDSFDLFQKPIEDAAKAMLTAGAGNLLAELHYDLAFDLSNPRAVVYIEQHGAALIAKINQETRSQIKTLLRQAVDEGWSYRKTARAIIARYGEMATGVPGNFTSRAERIAVTECGEAYEEGNWIPVQDLAEGGVKMEKSWDTAPELSKTGPCAEICEPNGAEGWIPADQLHQSGDDHPLGHVGCYCDERYQVAPEKG